MPSSVRGLHHLPGDADVLLQRLAGGVDHDRGVEAALDAVKGGGKVAVIQMHGEDGLGKDLVGGLDHSLEHPLVGVGAGAFGDLDDERRPGVDVAPEQAEGLLHVVDVVRADGEPAVGDLE